MATIGGESFATDSTTTPPETSKFPVSKVSWLLDTRKRAVNKKAPTYFLACTGLSNDDVGVGKRHTW